MNEEIKLRRVMTTEIYCIVCGRKRTFVELEPANQNLNSRGGQIREFECQECGFVTTEDD